MFSLSQFRALVAVAESGSVRRAAEKLGRTPSAVSMMLSQLEERLGVPMFEGARKTELTEVGSFVLNEARALLGHHERVSREIRSYAQGRSGRLDVACIPSVANVLLPGALTLLWGELPDIAVHVHDSNSASVIEMVRTDECEIGVATALGLTEEIAFAPLFHDAIAVVCQTGHALSRIRRPLSWSDLAPYPFIGNSSYSLIEAPQLFECTRRQIAFLPNITSLVAVLRSGAGISLLPKINALHAGTGLEFLPLADHAATRCVGLTTRTGRTLSPSARHFIAALKATVASEGSRYFANADDVVRSARAIDTLRVTE